MCDADCVLQTKLFTSSEVPIYQIFSDDPSQKSSHISDHMRSAMEGLVASLEEGFTELKAPMSSAFRGDCSCSVSQRLMHVPLLPGSALGRARIHTERGAHADDCA